MSGRRDQAVAADRSRVQRSALRSGLWVGLASAAVVTVLTATIVATLFTTSRPDHRPSGGGRPRPGRVVELEDILPIVIVVGVVGVLLLSVIAWYASRRASAPLAAALAVQRSFVADASHELRTPLTTLNSRIQLAEHRLRQGDDVAAALRDMRQDAAVMDAVLTDLLLAAETAGSRESDAAAEASVLSSLQDAARLLGPRADERSVRLVVTAPEDLVVAAELTALTRAVVAVLDNAVRYSPDGGTAHLAAVAAGQSAEIRVSDQGPGFTGIDPERAFERFARSTTSTERRGFGLGLPLARDIADRFGGSVRVESTSSAGTTFLFTLPRR